MRHEICDLLGYYTASCGNYLPTFRDNVSVPSSRVKIPSRKKKYTQSLRLIVSLYRDCAAGWTVPGSNPVTCKRFSLLQNVQTGSGAHPASY
jgi:hypothetical protein